MISSVLRPTRTVGSGSLPEPDACPAAADDSAPNSVPAVRGTAKALQGRATAQALADIMCHAFSHVTGRTGAGKAAKPPARTAKSRGRRYYGHRPCRGWRCLIGCIAVWRSCVIIAGAVTSGGTGSGTHDGTMGVLEGEPELDDDVSIIPYSPLRSPF